LIVNLTILTTPTGSIMPIHSTKRKGDKYVCVCVPPLLLLP
jgi:hypothetical protein